MYRASVPGGATHPLKLIVFSGYPGINETSYTIMTIDLGADCSRF